MQLHMQADGVTSIKLVRGIIAILIFTSSLSVFYNIEEGSADVLPKFNVDDDNNAVPWDGSSGYPFRYIQDAINAASPGDRIVVLGGTYTENIEINSSKTSLNLFGEDKSITTISGGSSGDVITIRATGVDISGFTIKSSGTSSNNAAIKINASNSVIVDNTISNSRYGVYIYNCSNTKIYYNTITTNSRDGIHAENSSYNNITYSTITSSTYNGIFLYNCSNNTIGNNTITSNSRNGIYLNLTCNDSGISNNYIASNTRNGIYLNDHCNNNAITHNNGNNKIYSNGYSGIRLENSSSNHVGYNTISSNTDYGIMGLGSNNKIHNSTISSNSKHGVFLFGDNNNYIEFNTISGNTKDGIRIQNSTDDQIFRNEISNNSQYGLYLNYYSVDNTIYNNYFHDNSVNAYDLSENNNIWSISTITGYNIVNGANSKVAGNYWGDYDNETEGAYDTNGNGLADSAYSIDISSSDTRPILDIIDPTISAPSVTDSTVTVGSYTYISTTITDNVGIEEVRLIYTDPNGQTNNISITRFNSGNTYYYNYQFSPVGNYSYQIFARDARNWAISSTKTFEVEEGQAPTIVDNSPSTGSPGQIFLFNVTVTDDSDVASDLIVKVNWDHGDSGDNVTMVNTEGDYFEMGVELESSSRDLFYSIYASDQWGNNLTTAQQSVTITDSQLPEIVIGTHGPTPNNLPNSYTFSAMITDNVGIDSVSIEYWYNQIDHLTVPMDLKSTNYYEKIIVIESNPDIVYCIIYANDIAGNQNNTKKPFIDFNYPYTGVIAQEITFDASNSYDLDGNISEYLWTFGDGLTATGSTVTHSYSSNGNYTVELTITDNDGNIKTNTTYALINSTIQQKTTQNTLATLENNYDIILTELFYSYDTDGDAITDTFIDPNNVLIPVHSSQIEIENESIFLLSIDDSEYPEFIWNPTTDEIITITNTQGEINNTLFDEENQQVRIDVSIEKTNGWLYIEVFDPDLEDYGDIENLITITKNNVEIDENKIFRKDGKTFILDDPDVIYWLVFSYTLPTLEQGSFTPSQGSTINQENPTISVVYNIEVVDIYAVFYTMENGSIIWEADISSDLESSDLKTFNYTPPNNLRNGVYYLEIDAQDEYGNMIYDSIFYHYESYAPIQEEISILPFFIIIGVIFGVVIGIYILMRRKNITFESFIYFKNRKIIPFFKPIVFGPLKLDVNDEKVKKAEFYVNGMLKETLTEAPYTWMWDEKSFMKHKIETKVYDEKGNMSTSGEMTFYLFNPPKLFK